MKVLFICPEFPDTFWSYRYAIRFLRRKTAFPPLGLLTVAALTPDSWEKRLIDLNVRRLTDSDLNWADFAFVTGMTVQRESARQVINRCKQSGVKVVAGGPLFTVEADQFQDVNHLVLNEAELTFPPFLKDLQAGCASPIYSTVEFADLRQTPPPLWELINLKDYATMSIQFSRGCPYDCDFCNVTVLLGHRPRIKTIEQIISELEYLYQLGWRRNIFFVDDNLIGNKRYLKSKLLPEVIHWRRKKSPLTFSAQVTLNLADDEELMEGLVEAGFDTVFIGIETPESESLSECNKKLNKGRDIITDVKKIQRFGLQVQGGFILGFDHDPPSIFQRQIDLIQRSGIVTAMVGMLQAPPGTQLFRRLQQEGRITGLMSGDNMDGTTNILPKMGLDILRDGYKMVVNHLYSPEHYYQRLRTFLKEYKAPKVSFPIDPENILAGIRSIFRLGIFGKERFHFWKLLLWTQIHRPKLVPLAITLAVYGYHFRKISEVHIV